MLKGSATALVLIALALVAITFGGYVALTGANIFQETLGTQPQGELGGGEVTPAPTVTTPVAPSTATTPVEVVTPFTLNTYGTAYGWAPCESNLDGFCSCKGYVRADTNGCYYEYVTGDRWMWTLGTSPICMTKTASTGSGYGITKVRCIPDVNPPSVDITVSNSAPKIGETVKFTATAVDDIKLGSITIYLDGSGVKNCATSPCEYSTSFPAYGTHEYFAAAEDWVHNHNETARKNVIISPGGCYGSLIVSIPTKIAKAGSSLGVGVSGLSACSGTIDVVLQWLGSPHTSCTIVGGAGCSAYFIAPSSTGTYDIDALFDIDGSGMRNDAPGEYARDSFYVDGTPPSLKVTLPAKSLVGKTDNIIANASDNTALKNISITIGGKTTNCTTSKVNDTCIHPFTPAGTGTYNYQIITYDQFGYSNSSSGSIGVTSAPITTSFSATPALITVGSSSTLSWSSTNASSCNATWTAKTSTSGSEIVKPTTNTTYSITCKNTTAGLLITNSTTVTAVTATYQLTANKLGAGSGLLSISPPGVVPVTYPYKYNYTSGTLVSLTATADAGSAFAGWSGDCMGTGVCGLTMTSAKTVSATFTKIPGPASVGAITPITAQVGTSTTFYVSTSNDTKYCDFYWAGSYAGGMSKSIAQPIGSTSWKVPYTPTSTGTPKAYASCNNTAGGITKGADTTITVSPPPPPTLISETPANQDLNVAVDTNIVIVFSTAMDKPSTGSAFSMTVGPGGPSVTGTKSWSNGDKTLTFDPAANLAYNTAYNLQMAGTAKSAAGTLLGSGSGWAFKTSGATTTDCSGTHASCSTYWVPADCTRHGCTVSGGLIPSCGGTPHACNMDTTQVACVEGGCNWTGAIEYPTIVSVSPTGTNVPINVPVPIVVNFSKDMRLDPTVNSFSTYPKITMGTFRVLGKTLSFTPSLNLTAGTTYSVTINTSAADTAGNHLQTVYGWDFTTFTPDTTKPYVNVSISPASPSYGQTAVITVNASDNVAIHHGNIYFDGKNVVTSGVFNTPTATFKYTTPALSVGRHNYSGDAGDTSSNWNNTDIKYFDVLETGGQPCDPKKYGTDCSGYLVCSNITKTCTNDLEAPKVSVKISPENPKVGDVVTFNATATDDVGLFGLDIYLDKGWPDYPEGGRIASCGILGPTAGSCTVNTTKLGLKLTQGNHKLMAVVSDFAYNKTWKTDPTFAMSHAAYDPAGTNASNPNTWKTFKVTGQVELVIEPASQQGEPGDTLNYVAKVTNNRGASKSINFDINCPEDWECAPNSTKLSIGNSKTSSVPFAITSNESESLHPVQIQAMAYDVLNPEFNQSLTFTYDVNICDRKDPSISVKPSKFKGPAGGEGNFTITVTNKDSCTGYFDYDADCPADWDCELSKETGTMDAGKNDSVTLNVTTASDAEIDSYKINFTAVNHKDELYEATKTINYTIADCIDADGDGYYSESSGCEPSDCDDTNADINPGATEICIGGVDENCNGYIDDGCTGSGPVPTNASRDATPQYDTTTPTCGNNVVETGENCDGTSDAACPGLCSFGCSCPFIVGDGICESDVGESSAISLDCKKKVSGAGLAAAAVGTLGALAGGMYYFWRRRGRLGGLTAAQGVETATPGVDLDTAVNSMLSEGYNPREIHSNLEAGGWSHNKIDAAMESAQTDQEALGRIAEQQGVAAPTEKAKASRYVKKCLEQGYDPTQVRTAMISSGWPADAVDGAISKQTAKHLQAHAEKAGVIEPSSAHKEDLSDYIKKELSEGHTKQSIKKVLKDSGWSSSDINTAFKE